MKNKKGFTLIELLAVIVILAIIALVAIPIVLNMINNARKKAAESGAYGFIEAIEYNNGFAQSEQAGYTEITGNNLDVTTIDVKMKGKKPTSGTVSINDSGKVTSASLCVEGYQVTYENKEVTEVKKGCSSSSSSSSSETPSTPTEPDPIPQSYTIIFEERGGTEVDNITAEAGSTITLPSTSKDNYVFDGWYTEEEGGTKVTSIVMPSEDKTYYAHWSEPDTTAPTCTLKVTSSGVSFNTKSDNVAVTEYGMAKNSTPQYNGTTSLGLSYATFYGFVKDAAGNTGYCRAEITGANHLYIQTVKKCENVSGTYMFTCKQGSASCSPSDNTYTIQYCTGTIQNGECYQTSCSQTQLTTCTSSTVGQIRKTCSTAPATCNSGYTLISSNYCYRIY